MNNGIVKITINIVTLTLLVTINSSIYNAAPLLPSALPNTQEQVKQQIPDINTPRTAQEHRDLASQYLKKAIEYRQESQRHKKMQDEYAKGVAQPPKDLRENPYIKKMRIHCEKYSVLAEELAKESEELAKYHSLRAKEMGGQ